MAEPSFIPSVLIGYHGCERRVAEEVFSGRRSLLPSTNSYDWLGGGIYFWEGDAVRASEWAKGLKRPGRAGPAVVGAIIDPGLCLNLLERYYFEQVREAYDDLVRLSAASGTALPKNRRILGRRGYLLRNLDCATINICRSRQIERGAAPFDAVRAAFLEGDPIYPTAGFLDRNHIQICVVNPACIKGYFRPITDGAS